MFVMGALTSPNPMPKSTYPVNSSGVLASASNAANSTPLATIASPASSRGSRAPTAPTNRPDSGAKTSVMPAMGSMYSPASSADRPRTSWR
ncbi:hypothetical protein DF17_17105 [Streptomyces rimosus]|nr:hypothetical protein DF17_17105 [Streptomyces rimosus]